MTSSTRSKTVVKWNPFAYQRAFDQSTKPKVYLSTGYGGGKTYSLVMKMLKLAKINRGVPGGLLCPTLKMFKRDVLPTIKEICWKYGIKYHFHKTEFLLTFPQAKAQIWVFHGEDEGESIRGPNLGYMCINEVTLLDKPTFDAAIARVRVKRAKLRQVAMSGTPEGFNWAYDYFIAEQREDTDLIYGDMRENTHIAEDYAKMLMESYDELMVEQFVKGKFVNLNGKAALYSFDRAKHTSPEIERIRGLPIWVTCDFNVYPMAATLWNRMGPDSPVVLRGFDEINLHSASTEDLARVIRSKVGVEDEVVIFPDPAGTARSTKSNVTDIEILEAAKFADIRYKKKIKSVRDCLNAANALISKDKVILNSKTCKQTIMDFEKVSLKTGTAELDKKDPMRTHWVDGFKNMADYEFPITVGAGGWRTQQVR